MSTAQIYSLSLRVQTIWSRRFTFFGTLENMHDILRWLDFWRVRTFGHLVLLWQKMSSAISPWLWICCQLILTCTSSDLTTRLNHEEYSVAQKHQKAKTCKNTIAKLQRWLRLDFLSLEIHFNCLKSNNQPQGTRLMMDFKHCVACHHIRYDKGGLKSHQSKKTKIIPQCLFFCWTLKTRSLCQALVQQRSKRLLWICLLSCHTTIYELKFKLFKTMFLSSKAANREAKTREHMDFSPPAYMQNLPLKHATCPQTSGCRFRQTIHRLNVAHLFVF